jgi:hypothetical protein
MPQIPSGFGQNRGILLFCGGQQSLLSDSPHKLTKIIKIDVLVHSS